MFKDKTVFILGAGSNASYGFPTGEKLVDQIVVLLREPLNPQLNSDDEKFKRHISEKFKNIKDEVAQDLALSIDGTDTVDEYIAIHKNDKELIGLVKQCLVYVILRAERNSLLFADNEPSNFRFEYNKSNSFYNKFWRAARLYSTVNDLSYCLGKVSIVSFNYDRSLEHFLLTRVTKTYRIEKEAASDILRKSLDFIHVYNHLKSPDKNGKHTDFLGGLDNLAFGAKLESYIDRIEAIAEGIGTIELNTNTSSTKPVFRQKIEDSKYVYAVGFGYNSANLSHIFPKPEDKLSSPVKKQFKGTLFIDDESSFKSEQIRISAQLAKLLKPFDTHVASGRELINDIANNLHKIRGAEFMDRFYYDMIEPD